MKSVGAEYIKSKRRDFALYILSNRSIPAISDGLKPAARRVLWTARDGKKIKSATLAGATMPIHPHASPEGIINTIAGPYGNNIPLLTGIGAFGTLLAPDAYGASRYTSVKISEFTKDVIFRDIEIIPMKENYDSTLMEPCHFLPLVPISLINPSEGIAIGYSTTILPRKLEDVVMAQLTHLGGGEITSLTPTFVPTNNVAEKVDDKWMFNGSVERINSTNVKITKIPFGSTHAKIVGNEKSKLNKLLENGTILDYEDHSSKQIDIRVKFKRGALAKINDNKLISMFGLAVNAIEHMNLINFDGTSILTTSDVEVIRSFTDWRLKWYVPRYERLNDMLSIDIQRYKDVITAIENNAGQVASTLKDKKKLQEWLSSLGIVYDDYIASLPSYRYTIDERNKTETLLGKALRQQLIYEGILSSEIKRKNIYKNELKELLTRFK